MRVEVKILTFVLQKTAVFIHNEVHWKPSHKQLPKRYRPATNISANTNNRVIEIRQMKEYFKLNLK